MVRKKDSFPTISVVIPSYNKGKYIKKTLQSIVDQNYPFLEVIVQDGGSNDETIEILKRYSKKNNFIKWISKKDGGQAEAINKGLSQAKGEILTFINADDVYNKGAFFEVAKAFTKNPECLWITGFGDIIDDKDRQMSGWVTSYKNSFIKFNNFQLLLMVNYITQPSTFITREGYKKVGSFEGSKKYVLEYKYWLKLGKIKMPIVIKKNLSSFRLTMDNISATSFSELLEEDNQIAAEYTKNKLILFLHIAHNWARVIIIKFLK